MSYIDRDGDTILETVAEVRAFARETPCVHCRSEARELLYVVGGADTVKLVFTTSCEHDSGVREESEMP
jgi:hypothetical protein